MASTSGITSSLSNYLPSLTNPALRILKVIIKDEQIIIESETLIQNSFEDDFNLLPTIVELNKAAYLIFRLDSNSFIFYSFVPDACIVKDKMIYASTRLNLIKTLTESSFSFLPVFASTLDDLTYKSYLDHLNHLSSEAPLSDREREMLKIKNDEMLEQSNNSGSVGRSMLVGGNVGGASVGLEWTEEAQLIAEEFLKGEKGIIRLEIDTTKETIIVATDQPTSLVLPLSVPAYTFYKHSDRIVFIYSCPPSSPIKSRLLYSSSANGVSQTAKSLGLAVIKKIETSTPEEIDDAYILEELGPVVVEGETSTASAPLPTSSENAFSKPGRPGRKR